MNIALDQNNQDIHMWISGLMPLFAEPIREGLISLANRPQGNNNIKDYNLFKEKTKHITKDFPDELKTLINTQAKLYYESNPSHKNITNENM